MAKRAGVKLDAVRKVAALPPAAAWAEPRAVYYAPAGPGGRRKGFAVYDGQGFYLGETFTNRPKLLLPHTKAAAHIKRRMVEDAPKRKPTRDV